MPCPDDAGWSAPMRRGWVACAAAVASLLVPACKPKPSVAPEPAPAVDPDPSPAPADRPPATEPGPAEKPPEPKSACAEQGAPWAGEPGTCLYVHDGCCYPDPASLCAAAGCDDDTCMVVESRPAAARCNAAASADKS